MIKFIQKRPRLTRILICFFFSIAIAFLDDALGIFSGRSGGLPEGVTPGLDDGWSLDDAQGTLSILAIGLLAGITWAIVYKE